MHIDQCFPSTYLKPADIPQGREAVVVIERFEAVHFDDGDKPCIFFEGKTKGFLLNRTNANSLREAFGPITDNWIGGSIVIFATSTDYAGKRVPCLRVRVPERVNAGDSRPPAPHHQPAPKSPPAASPSPTASPASTTADDEIPF
jgi:hypothetical protein